MHSRRPLTAALVSIVAVFVAGCGGTTTSGTDTTPKPPSLNIAFLPKAINNPYFDAAATGAKKAAAELSGKFQQVGPSTGSGAAQIPFIQTLTQQKVSAIVVSADDPDAIAPALKAAQAAGIKIVGYDSSPATDARSIFINQADTKGIGDALIKSICNEIAGCAGQIAILSATSTATNQNAWIDIIKADLQSNSAYSGLKLVKTAYGNDDPQASTTETQGLLSGYPDLKGIISPTSVGIVAAAQVLQQGGKTGKVQLTGLGTPNSMKAYVADGTCKEFALWDVEHLGYLAYYTAALEVQGKISGKAGETFTAGTLGQYTVGDNGLVILGPPTIFNKDNINNFNY